MKEITLQSEMDDLPLCMLVKEPEEQAKGIVQIVHGMAEHKGRYQEFMEYMASKGYIAICHDQRGHGKSVRNIEDLGYFYENTGNYVTEDVHQITKWAKEQYPALPVILLGHSMGSMIVRKYCQTYDADIDKMIVCGSPSQNKKAGIGCMVARLLEMVQGAHHRSAFLNKQIFGHKNKPGKSWLCTDETVVEEYSKDPLCGFTFTINGFQNVFQLNKDIYDEKLWNVSQPKLPILFLAGSEDPIILSKQAWEKSQEFLKQVGYTNVNGKLYPGAKHAILTEANKQEVYEDIYHWIEREG